MRSEKSPMSYDPERDESEAMLRETLHTILAVNMDDETIERLDLEAQNSRVGHLVLKGMFLGTEGNELAPIELVLRGERKNKLLIDIHGYSDDYSVRGSRIKVRHGSDRLERASTYDMDILRAKLSMTDWGHKQPDLTRPNESGL